MIDQTVTQLGLTFLYLAFAGLMALIQRVERSVAIRFWMISLLFFALDAGISGLRSAYNLPEVTRVLAWCSLGVGALIGLAGTLRFLGKGIFSKGLLLLLACLGGVLVAGGLLKIDVDYLRPVIFVTVGVTFAWIGVLTYRAGIPGGSGRWVAGSAFFMAALYAIFWPLLRQTVLIAQMEFFFDLMVLVWGATGVLLMHFDQARQRIRELAEKELALREKLAQAERLDSLGRLAAGVAHDFNNVLTTVISGSELVLRQLDDRDKAAARLKMVIQAAESSAGFTRQLLALGRRHLPGRRPTRLIVAVAEAMKIIEPAMSAKIEISVTKIPDTLAVSAAEGQLEQILVNLALNARDAMPDGGHLDIEVTPSAEENGPVRLLVEDTGVGMDEKTLAHLFDPFFSSKDAGGTGLGMATVYAIVQQLDGEISVSSTIGNGTRIAIDLPTCASVPVEREAEPAEPVNPAVTPAYKRPFSPA